MSLERIDPQTLKGNLILDHYSRYVFAAQYAKGKRILDAACGYGYGSCLLKLEGAHSIVGIDNSIEAIEYAREVYSQSDIQYTHLDAHVVGDVLAGPFDVVISFETIEHLSDPERFVAGCKKVMQLGSIFICSVPNDRHLVNSNPYHIHQFDQTSLYELLQPYFLNVRIIPQYFVINSTIDPSLPIGKNDLCTLDGKIVYIGSDRCKPDCLIAVCSDSKLEEPKPCSVQGQQFYQYYSDIEKMMADRHCWIQAQEKAITWLEEQKQSWERIAEDRHYWTKEQDNAIAWLEKQRIGWERIAKEKEIESLCNEKQSGHWKSLAHERGQMMERLDRDRNAWRNIAAINIEKVKELDKFKLKFDSMVIVRIAKRFGFM